MQELLELQEVNVEDTVEEIEASVFCDNKVTFGCC